MLDHKIDIFGKIKELSHPMIGVAMEERRLEIQKEVSRVIGQMASRGIGASSFPAVQNLCGHEIEVRALLIWGILHRVLMTLRVRSADINGADLKQEVRNNLPLNDLIQLLQGPAQAGVWTVPPDPLDAARNRSLRKVDAEIDLFIVSIQQVDTGTSPSTINFYSPVGVVQTGAGATATVFQNATLEDKEKLLDLLRQVKDSLSKLDTVPGYSKEEIVDLISEGETEIEKPKPNGLRLKSVLSTIGEALRSVNTLHQIYNSLKTILIPYGILLP